MGRGDTKSASRFGDIVAVCDVDESHAAAAAKKFTKGEKVPTQFTDFRRVLERKDVNIIVQATPDHWHTLINLAAAVGQEGHLRREAADADHRRRQADGQGRASARHRAPDRHAAAQPQALSPGVRAGAQRTNRQADAGVRVRTGAACARDRSRPCRCPRDFTGTSGSARRRRWITSRSGATALPLVVGLLRRPGHRLGRASQRHRAVGHRPRRPGRRSRRARRSSRSPAATPRRRSSRRR